MIRAVFLGCLLALGACERPAPPPRYEARMSFTVPDGTEVVVDGKVVGAFAKQKAAFELPKGKTLKSAKSLAVRFGTVCGHAERPVQLSNDAIEDLKQTVEGNKQRTIEVALEMDLERVPVRTTVWVDPEAKGDVAIGSKVLGKGPNRVILADCDAKGRTVTVGGESRGPVPENDRKNQQQLFIPASKASCYELRTHVYEEGAPVPDRQTSKALSNEPFYQLPLVSFFLREAPETIEVLKGSPTEEKKQLARVECEAKAEE